MRIPVRIPEENGYARADQSVRDFFVYLRNCCGNAAAIVVALIIALVFADGVNLVGLLPSGDENLSSSLAYSVNIFNGIPRRSRETGRRERGGGENRVYFESYFRASFAPLPLVLPSSSTKRRFETLSRYATSFPPPNFALNAPG